MKTKEIFAIILFLMLLIVGLSGCTEENGGNTDDNQDKDEKDNDDQYDWSTMDEGPYNDKISYATSTDLLTWMDSSEILSEHASVPGAVYKDDIIYVYFVDVSEDGIAERTGLIRSEDNGQTWLDKEFVVFEGIGDKVPVDPAPFLLDNGDIRIYYYDINEGRSNVEPGVTNKIYSAVSSDGITFVQEDGVRFSDKDIYDPDVIEVDGTWRMYVGNLVENKVISATSTDGLTFTKEGTAYSGGVVPDVFFKDDTYYLYTVGIDISTSTDGSTFTKTSNNFNTQLGTLTADPSVIELNDGTYMMFYKTQN